MKCPFCGREMEKGGTIAFGTTTVRWLPLKEYESEQYERASSHGYELGSIEYPLDWGTKQMVRLGTTHFCSNCYKAVGFFDVDP